MPAALTEKVTACPVVAVWLTGCVMIDGATAVEPLTLRIPAVLAALPMLFVTTTVNKARLSAAVTGGVVYEDDVAPLIAFPFSIHW